MAHRLPVANFKFCKHMSAGHRPMIDRGHVADQKLLRSYTDLSDFFLRCSDFEEILRCPDIVRRPEGVWLRCNSPGFPTTYYASKHHKTRLKITKLITIHLIGIKSKLGIISTYYFSALYTIIFFSHNYGPKSSIYVNVIVKTNRIQMFGKDLNIWIRVF